MAAAAAACRQQSSLCQQVEARVGKSNQQTRRFISENQRPQVAGRRPTATEVRDRKAPFRKPEGSCGTHEAGATCSTCSCTKKYCSSTQTSLGLSAELTSHIAGLGKSVTWQRLASLYTTCAGACVCVRGADVAWHFLGVCRFGLGRLP